MWRKLVLLASLVACGDVSDNGGGPDGGYQASCGDGIVQPPEQCDDGNATGGDGCETDCTLPSCGNGIRDGSEDCDDGNTTDGDACENNCTFPRCGNTIIDPGEQCDDGNTQNGDGCEINCTLTPPCDLSKPFGTPTRIATINSSVRDQGAVFVDDVTLIFGSDRAGSADLYMSTRSSPTSPFSPPVPLTTINRSTSGEVGPYLTTDGLTMYYVFSPPGTTFGDIFVTSRASKSQAFPLGTPVANVNSTSDEEDPYVTPDGSALYFGSGRGGTQLDLYVAVRQGDGSFGAPQPLTTLNTSVTDGHPRLTHDGLRIYWSSPRTDGGAQGGTDIWTATRSSTAGTFGSPTRVPELSTPANESPSWISPDGCTILLQSDRPGGMGAQDIYQAVKPR